MNDRVRGILPVYLLVSVLEFARFSAPPLVLLVLVLRYC